MDLLLDNNPASPTYGDVLLQPNGDFQTIDGQNEVLQNILQNLRTFYGEWFLDTTIGVDYFGQILIKNPSPGIINAIFIDAILSTPGVQYLLTYNFSPNFVTRQLTVTFKVQTSSGIVDYAGLIST